MRSHHPHGTTCEAHSKRESSALECTQAAMQNSMFEGVCGHGRFARALKCRVCVQKPTSAISSNTDVQLLWCRLPWHTHGDQWGLYLCQRRPGCLVLRHMRHQLRWQCHRFLPKWRWCLERDRHMCARCGDASIEAVPVCVGTSDACPACVCL